MLSSIIGEQENCLDAGNLVGIKHHFTKKKQQTGIGVLVFQFPDCDRILQTYVFQN